MTPFPALGVGSPLVDPRVIFQLDSDASNSSEFSFDYGMSSANGGTVILALTRFSVAVGGDPNGSPTITTLAAFTPGADTLVHRLDSSIIGALALTFVRGQIEYLAISRPIAGPGTHPGDWNLINYKLNPL
jgi:hypothetical protein